MAQTKMSAAKKPSKYVMTVAGQLFKHLGLQMYSGAVPALAELISNSYDAMAKNVWITLPVDRPLKPNDTVIVEDDGHGMSSADVSQLYLTVGRDRRSLGDFTKPYNGLLARKVQGRKGIGKLAGFGIADRIDIRTISQKRVSHLALDFTEITKSKAFVAQRGYEPEVLQDDGSTTREKSGTKIILSQLKISRAVSKDQFRTGLARRLLILDSDFTVHINGKAITRQEVPLQFRFPKKRRDWEDEDLGGGRTIKWWAGFSKNTIPQEEQRGFVVYVRGKLAQTPWLFDLSGGTFGQHGMQYLTGEVQADFLDESIDLVATDRGTIRWEDPVAAPLKEWGQKKIKSLLKKWIQKRRTDKIQSPKIVQLLKQAEKLPVKDRKIFKALVDKIVSIPQLDRDEEGKDIADELVEFVYNALTNKSFLDAIRRLNSASASDIAQFSEVLSEWDILEAISTAHLVKGRVEIIRKFEQLIKIKAPEKPDMQDYVKDHPWLIDPAWTMLVHERSLDKVISDEFKLAESKDAEGGRRLDFFCLGNSQAAYVVEVKRPGALVGRKEFEQLRNYVFFLRRRMQESSDSKYRRQEVKGLLIADRVRDGDEEHLKSSLHAGDFDRRTWTNLLLTTEALHREFLDVVKDRAPAEDPRMQGLTDNLNTRSKKKRASSGPRKNARKTKMRGLKIG
ncbi:MAG: hypothetical protein QOJ84_4312 [Bradyrhizobium sp.]|jgi:hypothetical protein|nr:hypothetical protein [Bradyrhizobium sp.]